MIIAPDNFYYFILLFSISLGFGIYSLLSYQRNWLNYINAIIFFLCAARAMTEYWVQQVSTYEEANAILKYNGTLAQLFFSLTWLMVYSHVRPFKKAKYAEWIDSFIKYVLIGFPCILICYLLFERVLFITNSEQIKGYWTFRPTASSLMTPYLIYNYVLMGGLFHFGVMIYSMLSEKVNRRKKGILIALMAYMIFAVNLNNHVVVDSVWRVSSLGMNMLIDALIVTWFVSGYRIIRDQYEDASYEILNSLSELIIRTDNQLHIKHMNSAATQVLGEYEKDTSLYKYIKPQLLSQGQNSIKNLVNKSREQVSLNIVDQQGHQKSFVAKVAPYRWRGQLAGLSIIFTDITELKQKEAQLEKANQTKDMLFSILAHDLRKPALSFRSIAKKINYLLSKRDFEGLDRLGHSIEKSAISLNSLLDNLLNWSLSQKDMVSVRPRTIALKKLIKEVINMIEILAQEKHIKINDESIEDIIIQTDPDILMTIIRNVLDNAIKYTPKEGSIYIKMNDTIESTTITIRDTGIGMTPEQISRIRNQQNLISTTGTSGEKGSGMGISMVINLLTKLNGTLAVESIINHGTTLQIQLRKSFDTVQSQLSASSSQTKSST